MKRCILNSAAVLTIFAVLICSPTPAAESKAKEKESAVTLTGFDPSHRETWAETLKAHQSVQDALVESLAEIALDGSRDREDRRQAISVIGQIGTARALEFLREHFYLYVPVEEISAAQRDYGFPCAFALSQGDWRHAETLVKLLDRPRSEHEQMLIGGALKRILGSEVARAVLRREHKRRWTDKELQATIAGVERFAADQ